eukprot:scaffold9085_cov215-Amphora_coffeaeformis.AAC.20
MTWCTRESGLSGTYSMTLTYCGGTDSSFGLDTGGCCCCCCCCLTRDVVCMFRGKSPQRPLPLATRFHTNVSGAAAVPSQVHTKEDSKKKVPRSGIQSGAW